jgi:hypothetical protein
MTSVDEAEIPKTSEPLRRNKSSLLSEICAREEALAPQAESIAAELPQKARDSVDELRASERNCNPLCKRNAMLRLCLVKSNRTLDSYL